MKYILSIPLIVSLFLLIACGTSVTTSTVTITPSPTPPPTLTITRTVTATPALTPTIMPTHTSTPAATSIPTPKLMTLQQFLEDNYGPCQTSLGPTSFTFTIDENDSILFPYDYWIQVEYDSDFFYDLKYSIAITKEMNHQVCDELKNFQEELARAVIEFMPDKKFYGGYFDSWYRYPELKLDLITRYYYSWVNYTPVSGLANYDETTVSEFQWYPLIDDELTR